MKEYGLLIGGDRRDTGDRLDVASPYDGQVWARVCRASAAEADEAIARAEKMRRTMAGMPSHRRSAILRETARTLRERREELARVITLECGKPIRDARTEVERAALTFDIAAEEAARIGGEVIPLDRNAASEGRWGLTRRFPVGPVFGITPFNFPLNLVAHKVAPAIAAGNPVIIKPASKTPVSCLILGEIVYGAGLPEGAMSVLPCSPQVAEEIACDERIMFLSFTGSAQTGWHLKQKVPRKKVALELGGNAGVLVNDDADVGYAARRCAYGSFYNAGQVCISVQRIYVHEAVFDLFLDRMIPLTQALKAGDPMKEDTDIGPVIDAGNLARIVEWVADACAAGARVLTGGRHEGAVYFPTVLTDVTPDMKVCSLEVFGPVVVVQKVKDFGEGIGAINHSPYGLQAGVFTADISRAFRAFEDLDVGGVVVNDIPSYRIDHMPYGGVKESGFGREGVRYTIEEMTELKLMVVNLAQGT